MKYYLTQTLIVTPLSTALLVLVQSLPWNLSYLGDALMLLPSIACCAIHLWVRQERILSLGSLYACIMLPLLGATLYCIYAQYQHPNESMIAILYLVMWLLNFLASACLLTLTALGRFAFGARS